MKKVTITQLKNDLSALMDLVKSGHILIVMDRNAPFARISSLSSESKSTDDGRLLRLERAGLATRGSSKEIKKLSAMPLPRLRKNAKSLVEALIEERRSGR